MKKIIILLTIFILVGCTNSLSSTLSIDSGVKAILSQNSAEANTNGQGFKYYKPRDFSIIEDNIYNQVLINNGNKYYLNIDINGYYNQKNNSASYEADASLYFSTKFYYNNIFGYVEIRSRNNDYFYIKMMYNYSNIEVSVKENEIKEAIMNSAIILSSIKYNNIVIGKLISDGDLSSKESTYELKKPTNNESNKNLLQVYEYDNFVGDN